MPRRNPRRNPTPGDDDAPGDDVPDGQNDIGAVLRALLGRLRSLEERLDGPTRDDVQLTTSRQWRGQWK